VPYFTLISDMRCTNSTIRQIWSFWPSTKTCFLGLTRAHKPKHLDR